MADETDSITFGKVREDGESEEKEAVMKETIIKVLKSLDSTKSSVSTILL